MGRRRRSEIGKEEIELRAVVTTVELRELAIRGIEPYRDVGLAARHLVDVLLELNHGTVDNRGMGAGCVEPPAALLEGLAKPRGAAHAHHVQRAAHLVQMLRTAGQRARGEVGAHALERLVDLGSDPRQDGGIGHQPSLKPATELFSPSASCVRRAADAAVFLVPSVVSCVTPRMIFILPATWSAEVACWRVALEIAPISSARRFEIFSISRRAWSASSAVLVPSTTPRVLRSMASTASCVSRWMLLTIAPMCLVASAERSASRCTSSATTVKPRPASPAEAAWIAAFSARTFVCSVISEISSTISPIS